MNRISSFFAGFIPQYISAGAILGFLKIFSFRIPEKTRNRHFQANEKAWADAEKKAVSGVYIERQSALSDLVLGKEKADYNACEVIAAYNACVSMKEMLSFPKLLSEFERLGLVFFGGFGTAPDRLLRYFRAKGLDASELRGKKMTKEAVGSMQEDYEVFLLTAFNDRKNILSEVHTVCISREEDGYRIHNGGLPDSAYSTLQEAVDGFNGGRGKPIVLIGVRSVRS